MAMHMRPRPRARRYGRWRPGYIKRHPAFTATMFVLAALVSAGCAALDGYQTAQLRAHGQMATATAVDVFDTRRGLAIWEFTTADGELRSVRERFRWSGTQLPQVGDQTVVVYDPDRSYNNSLHGPPGYRSVLLLALLAAALAALGWLVSIRRWRSLVEAAERWRMTQT